MVLGVHKLQVILCENHILEKETFESTVIHELVSTPHDSSDIYADISIAVLLLLQIHAYDVCRAKMDFRDCTQHACTEVCKIIESV